MTENEIAHSAGNKNLDGNDDHRRKLMFAILFAVFIFSFNPRAALSQNAMDELAGTRQRLAMTCSAMIFASAQGTLPTATRHLTDSLNKNVQLRRRGETNLQFLTRFLDFHAAAAGLVVGREQPQEIIDRIYRSSFLLSQLTSSGDTDALRRIAEGCVMTFRSAPSER